MISQTTSTAMASYIGAGTCFLSPFHTSFILHSEALGVQIGGITRACVLSDSTALGSYNASTSTEVTIHNVLSYMPSYLPKLN